MVRIKRYLTVFFSAFIFLFAAFFLFSRENRKMFTTFFNTKCRNYRQPVVSRKLNDRVVDYISQARKSGIRECRDEADIRKRVRDRELFRVRGTRNYIVEDMTHSYPYLTRDSRALLKEIGRRFRKKAAREGLKGSRLIITSMTRTTEKMKGLKKGNGNISDNSPHLNGNAFDISYARFTFRKLFVTECDRWYLKEVLAEAIWELREEKKCWATYERAQGCFHVVSR